MQQTGARDGEERRRHEGPLSESRDQNGRARATRRTRRASIRRRSPTAAPRLRARRCHTVVTNGKRAARGIRKPAVRKNPPSHPRFHLHIPPARHTFVSVNLDLLKQAAVLPDRRTASWPACRRLKGAEVRRRSARLQGGEPGNRPLHLLRGRSQYLPHHSRVRGGKPWGLKPGACFGGEMAIFDPLERHERSPTPTER